MIPDKYSILQKTMREIRRRNNANVQQNVKRRINASTTQQVKRIKAQRSAVVVSGTSSIPAHAVNNNAVFPLDVLAHIFKFCDKETVLMMSLVCVHWKSGADASFRARSVSQLRNIMPQMSFEKFTFFSMHKGLESVVRQIDRALPDLFDLYGCRYEDFDKGTDYGDFIYRGILSHRCFEFMRMIASIWPVETVVKYIISKRNDDQHKKYDIRHDLLHLIIFSGSSEAVRLLLGAGANPNETVTALDLKPLHLLLLALSDGCVLPHVETYNIAGLLLRYGTDIDEQDEDGNDFIDNIASYIRHRKHNKDMLKLCWKVFALMASYSKTERYIDVMAREFSTELQKEIYAQIAEIKSKMASQSIVEVDPLKPPSPNCLELTIKV